MKNNMYSSSSPSHSHDHSFHQKPKTNNQSLQKARYPSFSFVESSTTNDVEKNNTEKKIIWCFSYSVAHNHNDVLKQNKHSCDVCNKVFTSNKALNAHMRCHGQNGPTVAAPSSEKQQPCRRRRYMNIDDDDDDVIETAAETLLQLSRMGYEDVNHRGAKRQKLSCNMMDDNEKKKKKKKKKKKEQGVLLTSGGHDIEEKKKINEGETELGSKVVKNFDLNELTSDDVVKNFDLNELPSDDNEGETELGSKVVKNFDLNELPSDEFEDETN